MADHQPRLQSEASAMAGEGRQLGQQPDGGTAVNGSGDGLDRPSFTEYWREEKEHERAGRLQFVSEVPFHPSSSSSPSLAAGHSSQVPGEGSQPDPSKPTSSVTPAGKSTEKAKLRRQQVRKAQVQHRTRKANYIKQLELDVSRFRDMIAAAEKEVLAYRRENEGMRGAARARGLVIPGELKGKGVVVAEVRVAPQEHEGQVGVQRGEVQMLPPPPPYVPGQYQTPQQQVDVQPPQYEQPPQPATGAQEAYQPQTVDYDPYPPVDLFGNVDMGDITVTMRKDDTLGTPCFQIASSSPTLVNPSSEPTSPDQLSPEQEIIAINLILAMEHICWNHFHPRQFPSHGDSCKAASGHTMMASTMCMSSAPQRVYRTIRRGEANTTTHSWPADTGAGSALSLKSLLSLARTLNPGDIELTPVQAWFELAARYGAAVLMEDVVIEALKREFCGVVDCIHFGAIIERDAFESVVERVMAEVGVRELEYEMDVDEGVPTGLGTGLGARQVAV
ncbi:hypothetical protein EsH8_I_000893 [Colletotrichum jinshuiense]